MAYLYKTRVLPALLLLWVAVTASAEPIDFTQVDPADHTFDHWYLDTIDSQAAGYWHVAMSIQDDHIVSTYHDHREEMHGGEKSTHDHRVVWTETKDFKPIRIVTTTAAGSDTVTKTYRFTEDGIDLTSEQNGRSIQRKLAPIKGDYLTAAQSSIATDLHLQRGNDSFELMALDVSVGMTPSVTTYQRSEGEPAELKLADGSETKAHLWVTTFAAFPGFEMKHWIDASHQIVGLTYKVDAMTFESRLADASVTGRTFDPPEMSGLSVVVPDRPIKNIDRQKKIVYELRYDAGDLDIVPISTAKQSVESLGQGKARVTVNLDAKPQAAEDDQPREKHLASSIMIDHEDKLVRRLAKKAAAKLKDDASQLQIAKACKRFVTQHIKGDSLSVGDGSASEAARTRTGDCTECSVLLAAMLRAHGIPSRCANGLVYSEDDFVGQEDVFVYHQWTQAWIEDKDGKGYWLDLDSAMWRYSAGHIAMGVSAMGDDDQQDLIKIVPMQQGLKINVIETRK